MVLSKHISNLARQAQYSSIAEGGCTSMRGVVEISRGLYQLCVEVPGLSPEKLRAEILNYDIMVYSYVHTLFDRANSHHRPLFMHTHTMPEDIDRNNIRARILGRMLHIELPRIERSRRAYHRVLPISK